MKILYYLTPHGFGHACRAWAIAKEFSPRVELIFRTTLPESIFREELTRPFAFFPEAFDCGCVQRDGVTLEKLQTLQKYRALAEQNALRIESEVDWIRRNHIDGTVADIPPFALEVARRAALPSIAVSNFTWYDIYGPFVEEYPAFRSDLEKMREQYAMADLLLSLHPALEMPYFHRKMKMPLVGRKGKNVRTLVVEEYGLDPGKSLGLIYTGNFGMDRIPWKNLEKFSDWEFIGLYPLPGEPGNYHLFRRGGISYPDLIASSEVMVSKIGYGTVAECMINGTPLIFLPRADFAESPIMEKEILDSNFGYRLSPEDYFHLNWESALAEVLSRGRPPAVDSRGARLCARVIEAFFEGKEIPEGPGFSILAPLEE